LEKTGLRLKLILAPATQKLPERKSNKNYKKTLSIKADLPWEDCLINQYKLAK
jgi:hypothetical protein